MTSEHVVNEDLTETLAELSRRPTREQYEIVVKERDELRKRIEDAGSFW